MSASMKKLLIGLLLISSTAMAGEDVSVTWELDTADGVPYSGFKLFWTDSTGVAQERIIPDPAARATEVLDVPFGNSSWHMRSLCDDCVTKESAPSSTVTLRVEFKGVPSAPSPSVSLVN